MAFLRVKLRGKAAASADRCSEQTAVIAFSQNQFPVFRNTVITVHEIKSFTVMLQTGGERGIRLKKLNSVPAHVGNLELRRSPKTDHATGENSQTLSVSFFGKFEKRLHPETNPKKWAIPRDPIAHGLIELRAAKRRHAISQ